MTEHDREARELFADRFTLLPAELTRRRPELCGVVPPEAHEGGLTAAVRGAAVDHVRHAGDDVARLVLIMDQFEEVCTECDDEVRKLRSCDGTPEGT